MKPIIFNTEMVKAMLDGRKTQTRRVIKVKNKLTRDWVKNTGVEWIKVDLKDEKYPYSIREQNGAWNDYSLKDFIKKYSPYKVDDVLYVKETFQTCECGFCEICQVLDGIVFKADYNNKGEHPDLYSCHEDETYWKPSIHLKEKDARIFLRVINVRIERLQDITFGDIEKEGYPHEVLLHHRILKHKAISAENKHEEDILNWWINNWNSTAKDGYKYEDNPPVFVYEFERIEK